MALAGVYTVTLDQIGFNNGPFPAFHDSAAHIFARTGWHGHKAGTFSGPLAGTGVFRGFAIIVALAGINTNTMNQIS